MWQRRIPTRYGLWAALTAALFVAAGCVNWVPEGKTVSYWAQWAIFLSGEYGCTATDFVFVLAMGGGCWPPRRPSWGGWCRPWRA